MKVEFKASAATAAAIYNAIAKIAGTDAYTRQTIEEGRATHHTAGGCEYNIELESLVLTFFGSRTSLRNGSRIGAVFRADDGVWSFTDRTNAGWAEYPLELVGVESSLPPECPFAHDPWASDAAIAAWVWDRDEAAFAALA